MSLRTNTLMRFRRRRTSEWTARRRSVTATCTSRARRRRRTRPTRSGTRSRRCLPGSRTLVANIRRQVSEPLRRKQATYTVKTGDTLSKIAKQLLGDANAYMDIFNANLDQLSDPDKIKPGQVRKVPHPPDK